MPAELGQIALILAFLVALLQFVIPFLGIRLGLSAWIAAVRPAAEAQFLLVSVAFAALIYSFITSDFSVRYVAEHGSSLLPLFYRISAAWGGHEGSVLLWSWILSLWTFAVARFSGGLDPVYLARVLGVLGGVAAGILGFILFTSNPFERLLPPPGEGADLNPLLQDPGLALHPPTLYMGYVGLAVPFSFAIAALMEGRLDRSWARWTRPWTLLAWSFLTAGITLGSWWAYYELGWGGWWFWDPVENASFMPWLVATALFHSLAVTEKRGAFRVWTVLLAITAFALSLLGMFLVRSGILVSVHAFANDPERGLYILLFIGLVVGSSLLLFALKAAKVREEVRFHWFSREALLLLNNVLLLAAAGTVLLGTLYPLLLDALGLGKISVGPPYFGTVFPIVTAPIFLLAGIGPLVPWKRGELSEVVREVRFLAPAALASALLVHLIWFDWKNPYSLLLLSAAFWLGATALLPLKRRISGRGLRRGLLAEPSGFYGMLLAHFGLALFLVGVGLSNSYSQEKTVRMAPGERYQLAGYTFRFLGVEERPGPNYRAVVGRFEVERGGERVALLLPEKRFYLIQRNVMTEAAIDPGLRRDLYIALGEELGEGAWSVRLYVKPAVRWIWLGGLFMVAGGMLAAADRRYRRARVKAEEAVAAEAV